MKRYLLIAAALALLTTAASGPLMPPLPPGIKPTMEYFKSAAARGAIHATDAAQNAPKRQVLSSIATVNCGQRHSPQASYPAHCRRSFGETATEGFRAQL